MFSETYQRLYNQIVPTNDLVEQTKLKTKATRHNNYRNPSSFYRKPLILTTAICVCILLTITVMATINPSINDLLSIVAPQVAQFLQPIELSSESNGIKMDVIAAMNDNETAVVYLTLQDLTADRVDSTVDLYNYSLNGPSAFTHDLIHYDAATKTATIRMLANGAKNLNHKRVTFQLDSFLSGKKLYQDEPINIGLNNVSHAKTIALNMNNIPGGGGEGYQSLQEKGTIQVLFPKQTSYKSQNNLEFVSISGIGYADGFLHVQTDWRKSVDNHGCIFFKDPLGNERMPYASVSFDIDKHGNAIYGNRYQEDIYKIPQTQLKNYKMYGSFTENKNYTETDLKVSFKLMPVDDSEIVMHQLKSGDINIDKLSITPLGISFWGSQEDAENYKFNVVLNDNSEISYDHAIEFTDGALIHVKFMSNLPIEIKNIKAIRINDTLFPIK